MRSRNRIRPRPKISAESLAKLNQEVRKEEAGPTSLGRSAKQLPPGWSNGRGPLAPDGQEGERLAFFHGHNLAPGFACVHALIDARVTGDARVPLGGR